MSLSMKSLALIEQLPHQSLRTVIQILVYILVHSLLPPEIEVVVQRSQNRLILLRKFLKYNETVFSLLFKSSSIYDPLIKFQQDRANHAVPAIY